MSYTFVLFYQTYISVFDFDHTFTSLYYSSMLLITLTTITIFGLGLITLIRHIFETPPCILKIEAYFSSARHDPLQDSGAELFRGFWLQGRCVEFLAARSFLVAALFIIWKFQFLVNYTFISLLLLYTLFCAKFCVWSHPLFWTVRFDPTWLEWTLNLRHAHISE